LQKMVLVPFQEWEKLKGNVDLRARHLMTVDVPQQEQKQEEQQINQPVQQGEASQIRREGAQENLTATGRSLIGRKQLKELEEPLKGNEVTVEVEAVRPKMLRLVDLVPEKVREYAKKLLDYVLRYDNISMNEKREFVYKGQPVVGSNLFHLLTHTLYHTQRQLLGIEKFYQALMEIDTPLSLIRNGYGKKVILEMKDKWRPPGELNRKVKKA